MSQIKLHSISESKNPAPTNEEDSFPDQLQPSNWDGMTWEDLATAAQKGNKRAYNQLLKEIATYSKSILSGRLANPEWAEDITQNVLVSVHKSLHTYRNERPFKPWLTSIIYFRRTDFLRKHYAKSRDKQTSLENPEFLHTHVTETGGEGEYKDIEAALAGLPSKQRKALEMIKIQGFSAKETAQEMDMSISAVKVAAHRGLQKLKDILGH